jgi:antirestriction protein ArdC
MSNHACRPRTGQDRASLYDEITDKIITELETGRVPWVRPWGTAAAKAPLAMPKNASCRVPLFEGASLPFRDAKSLSAQGAA